MGSKCKPSAIGALTLEELRGFRVTAMSGPMDGLDSRSWLANQKARLISPAGKVVIIYVKYKALLIKNCREAMQ